MPNKRRLLFMSGGCLWLFVAGAAFAVVSLEWIGTPLARVLTVGVVAVVMLCVLTTGFVMRAVHRLPGRVLPRTGAERTISRRFGVVFAAEGVGCGAVSWWCVATHHLPFIAAANIAVVGLHFLPLAQIFSVPRYYATGVLMVVIAVMTAVMIPTTLPLGHGLAIYAMPALACFPVLLITGILGVRDTWRETITTAPMSV